VILANALAEPAVRDALQSFFSMLSLALLAGTLIVLAARLLYGRVSLAATVIEGFRPFALPLAAAVTATSTLGSLYFSEIANYTPCILCWYQRTMMYPLGVVLTVFAVARRRGAGWVAVPLGLIGIVVSAYHFLLERVPGLHSPMCSTEVPCNVVWFAEFGFVSLAFMAFTGFLAAIVFTTLPAEPA
jgi:disulfide bond formation protein DsbB